MSNRHINEESSPFIFLDRDNTLNVDPGYLGNPDEVKLMPYVGESLALLTSFGFRFLVLSNQSGIARGYFTHNDADAVNEKINELLQPYGVQIEKFYYCPHQESDDCSCRKPKDGLVRQALLDFSVDTENSWMIGDAIRDIEAVQPVGISGILLAENPPEDTPNNLVFVAKDIKEASHFILQALFEKSYQHKIILNQTDLVQKRNTDKEHGKQWVFTNGCFDILHPGHLQLLYQARLLGDKLCVGINSDASVQRLKGDSRPVNSLSVRLLMLANLPYVDYVTVFEEDTPENLIQTLQPDIHVKGGDYQIHDLPESNIVHSYGGKVIILPFRKGFSTTKTIEKIMQK
ncbi:MAG: D-glycero-beta-D-manno-heptose 1-phosphate adenylyltransferase [Candidatus Hydrogenedentota bacterium]|nr:MAG: D-glycero-beta-D-manno-heptose 1-phosphate adenylyltransferase [Candidatus Hydrogenedentota bacterium]